MKRITSLIAIFGFFIWSTANANVVPEGYSTYIESSTAQIATKHNGQAVYIENSNPDNKIYIDVTVDDAVFWFSDGSYIQIDTTNERITQVGQLRPRTGDRKRDTYHISVLGREPVWEITTANRQLWERFSAFSGAVSGPLSASYTQSSLIAPSKQTPDPLEETNFVVQAADSCEAERDNALHGYNGHTTLTACYKTQDTYTVISAMAVIGACLSPVGVTVVGCGGAIAIHAGTITEKNEQIYQCQRAKDIADRDLRICEEAANNSGGGGWIEDPGTGGGGIGVVPVIPMLRCAVWMELKNTVLGDITYCAHWSTP